MVMCIITVVCEVYSHTFYHLSFHLGGFFFGYEVISGNGDYLLHD